MKGVRELPPDLLDRLAKIIPRLSTQSRRKGQNRESRHALADLPSTTNVERPHTTCCPSAEFIVDARDRPRSTADACQPGSGRSTLF
jgi:hypothetical protein